MARGFSWAQMGALSSFPFFLAVGAKALSGLACDRFHRHAPLCVMAMVGIAVGTYFGAVVHNNMLSALLLSLGIGAAGLGTPAAWTLLQGLVPEKAMSLSAGGMNGFGNAVSALSPTLVGVFISISGTYAGGLFFLVAMALIAAAATLILAIQKY
jgi:MFS family permease